MSVPANLDTIAGAALDHGLLVLGAFHAASVDGVPDLAGGPARTLVLIGNAGPAMWRHFATSSEYAHRSRPLDAWTERVIGSIAATLAARAHFPFRGPPYLPFQRWAIRGGAVHPSPIGLLIHPEFGLWHAYRGALAFAERLDLPAPAVAVSPCETCSDRPCLSTCPVGAFTQAGYDAAACRAHVASADGADCRAQGCRARRACPVGRAYVYEPEQAAFHMRHFLGKGR